MCEENEVRPKGLQNLTSISVQIWRKSSENFE